MMKVCIKKGKHYHSNLWFRITHFFHFRKCVTHDITFFEKNWYPKEDIKFTGWNKIFGLTGFFIHKNSMRIAWQPDFKRKNWFRLSGYCYVNSVRKTKYITSIKAGCTFKASICTIPGKMWTYKVNDILKTFRSEKTPHFIECQSYFGGKSKAPQKICIKYE